MKSVLLFIFFSIILFINQSQAQGMTFELLKPPCNNDGILKVNFTATGPVNLYWYYNGVSKLKTGVQPPSDTIFDYGGGHVTVYGTAGTTQYGTYNSDLPFKFSAIKTINTCPTPSTVEINVIGGTAPFNYQWYKNVNGIQVPFGSGNPKSVTTGQYDVAITDAAGCVVNNFASQQDSNYIYINAPVSYTYDVSITDANCTNGTAEIKNIVGGNAPFTFQWSNGATTQSLQNLIAGNYQLTVTDGDGCTTFEPEVYVQQSITINAQVTNTPATCSNSDGSAITFGAGGTPPYTYKWNTGETTQSIVNLGAGSYQVEVKDANGCYGNGYTNVTSNTPVIVTVLSNIASSCTAPTGFATLGVSGGTAPYSISWSTSPVQTGTTLSGVPPGYYSFVVTDNVGCIRTGGFNIQQESIINPNISSTDANCATATGSLSCFPSGGVSPYSYLWSNGSTQSSITNLFASNYIVSITDSKSCTIVKSGIVKKSPDLKLGFATTPASCIYSSDGSIIVNAINGTPPYTYNWSGGNKTNTLAGQKTGYYFVNVSDVNGCDLNTSVFLPFNPNNDDCYCSIEGTVFHDLNENCVQDAGEPGIMNAQVHCKGIGYMYTDASGHYAFQAKTGTYEVSESIQTYSPLSACQNNKIIVSVTAASGCTHTVDFANKLNPIHDVQIGLWNDNYAVPGFTHTQNMVITNAGTIDENNIIGSYTTDNQLGVPSFTPNFLNQAISAGYYINSSNMPLTAGSSQHIKVTYTVPTNIPLNTELYFTDSTNYQSPMSTWVNDYTPWNNVNQKRTTVTGSFDPNFMEVSPQGKTEYGYILQQDSVLDYMVHFQNYGNYFAQDVVVKIFLDPNLAFDSVRPTYSSSPALITRDENNMLIYTFKNIHLYPQSWNEALSKGFFSFSVKQKPSLTKGTKIQNKSDIYFDFNAPITTNTTLNTIDYRVSTNPEPSNDLIQKLYPNPSNSHFTLELNGFNNEKTQVIIMDLYGRQIKSVNMDKNNKQSIEINTTDINSGVYFVQVISGSQKSSIHKLIILNR